MPTTNYNTNIPVEIMTPDAVETRIGTLTFVDGVPAPETTRLAYDHLDFLRGVEAFLNFVPAASLEAMRRGNAERGAKASHQVLIFDQLMDSNPLWLTPNTDSTLALPRRQARKGTGSRRFLARDGLPSCVSMARPRRGSTRPGGPARSTK
jgi:hypothetical protein